MIKLDSSQICLIIVILLFAVFLDESIQAANDESGNHSPAQVFVIGPGETGEIYVNYSRISNYTIPSPSYPEIYWSDDSDTPLLSFSTQTSNITIKASPSMISFNSTKPYQTEVVA